MSRNTFAAQNDAMAEPIAVIGLDAKYPCDGDTPEAFYEFLVQGRSARRPVPKERYNAEAFWHPDSHRDGVIGGREGHFINADVRAFDAPFFSITPAEAASMDPQQRMTLECVYTAMENSGLTIDSVKGTQTGVYLGAFIFDYHDVLMQDVDAPMMYTGSGTIASTLAGRVSWFYDFKGPAMSIDTACSSSMVAFHQAVVGLKSRDCDMAIACGANLILSPHMGLELNALGVLNQDGRSYSFDDRANGYGRSEGIGAVVLKRMSDAIRDGDTIRAVIRNTGSNHDGHSPGLTAPSKDSQVELMQKTYAQAGIDPAQTRFFEAHGTGTPAGDPVEANAISDMFTRYRSADEPLYIGAVKSNIGHSEGASGIASIIKGILTLENGIIPANTNFERQNPNIKQAWHFRFPTKALEWPQTESGLRRMSLNSFGVSGTNAHVVMDDALHFLREQNLIAPHCTVDVPTLAPSSVRTLTTEATSDFRKPHLFVFSSQDKDGIARLCDTYQDNLHSIRGSLSDLSYTLAAKRSQFKWRIALVADSVQALQIGLTQKQSAIRAGDDKALGLIFTGQGAQWAQMGLALVKYPIFQQSVQSADEYLRTLGCDWAVLDELSKMSKESRVNEAEFSQPLCTILQVGLVDLLKDWGLSAAAVAGHSSGEIAAAYAAGAICQESAWRIAFWRGKLSANLAKSGSQPSTGMAAVGLDVPGAVNAIATVCANEFGGVSNLAIGCMNSRYSQTITGDATQIAALVRMLQTQGVFARQLNVEMAYHSKYMEDISAQYIERIGKIDAGQDGSLANPTFFSSTYGSVVELDTVRDATYWTENLVSTVRFSESIPVMLQADICGRQITDLLEIGPHDALRGPLRDISTDVRGKDAIRYHNTLKRGNDSVHDILQTVGSLFTTGIQIDLVKAGNPANDSCTMLTTLPRYPFNHSRQYWYESRLSRNFRNRPYARHELLGAPVNDWDGAHNAIWRNWIRLSENPWIEDHKVSGSMLYPAAGMLVMAIEGSRQLAERSQPEKEISGFRLRDVSFHTALPVPDDSMGVESHLYLRPSKEAAFENKPSSWLEFQVCTVQSDDEWREHCRGQIRIEYSESCTEVDGGLEERIRQAKSSDKISQAQQTCITKVEPESIYGGWNDVGLCFGPSFKTMSKAYVHPDSGTAYANVSSTTHIIKEMMPQGYMQDHLIHPTTLDGTMQVSLVPLVANPNRKQNDAVVLTSLEEMWVSGKSHGSDYSVCANAKPQGSKNYEMQCTSVDAKTNELKVSVSGLVVTEVKSEDQPQEQIDSPLNRAWATCWKPDVELLSSAEMSKAFDPANAFQQYVDALSHKNPSMKLLEIGWKNHNVVKATISALTDRFDSFDLTSVERSSLNDIPSDILETRICHREFDLMGRPSTQDFDLAAYDVVLAGTSLELLASEAQVLDNILSLLKPTGKLIVATEGDFKTKQSPYEGLVDSGAILEDGVLVDGSLTMNIFAMPITDDQTSLTSGCTDYYIAVDPDSNFQRSIALQLCDKFSAQELSGEYGSIRNLNQFATQRPGDDLSSTTFIILQELEAGLIDSLNEQTLEALKSMVNGRRVLWLNKDSPNTNLIAGFAACIRLENPDLDFVEISVQLGTGVHSIVESISKIIESRGTTKAIGETAYKINDNLINVPRLVEAVPLSEHIKERSEKQKQVQAPFGGDSERSLRLSIGNIGLLDSISFNDDPQFAQPLAEHDVEFRTLATAVNFKDLAVMLGKIKETPVGLEAAGIVTRVGSGVSRFREGDHVFGFAFNGAYSTHTRAQEGSLALVPQGLSSVEAAAIPIVYTTAFACLYDIGELGKTIGGKKRKSTVLVHAAAGGVGQAVIQLAQREGAEIFATVGSLEKRDFLETKYGLPRDHIFSSRDLTFKDGVLRQTGGRGVDIVINSLAGDALRATWECVAPFGRFAEIGLTDIESKARISMASFARGARFEAIELNYMRQQEESRVEDLFQRAMECVFDRGLEKSMPIAKYPVSQIQDALRRMQSGKHIGKLVVELNKDDIVPLIRPIVSVSKFDPAATYVVSGGFGGLGRDIIRWMVRQGSRNLIVLSRAGPITEEAHALVEDLRSKSVDIVAPPCDITSTKGLRSVIDKCLLRMPPIKGCIQASTILTDHLFSDMTVEEWEKTLSVKVKGTWNLWEATNSKATDERLDFFVMLSSMASIIGNPGQTNYSAGNAYQDALARSLSAQGHNAVALNVPMMNDAGMVATKPKLMEYLFGIGWSHMSSEELINALDYYCQPRDHQKSLNSDLVQVLPRLWLPKYTAAEGAQQPNWQTEARFSHMAVKGFQDGGALSGSNGASKGSAAALISRAASTGEAKDVVMNQLFKKLSDVLSVDPAEIDSSKPMYTYGVDSLVAVELRTWIVKELGADISVFEITGSQNIDEIGGKIAKISRFAQVVEE